MNRSCNSILCRFGIHTADPYVHIQVKCRNGSHRWQSNYEVCKRCGKRLRKIRRDLVIDLGNSVPHPDRFNCPYVNRIGQLTVSVLLNRFARKEHRA